MTDDPQARAAHARHELRTPVNAILGYSEMLLEDAGEAPAEFRAGLQHVQGLGRRLLALINDLMDASKIEAAGAALDMASLAAQVRQQLEAPTAEVVTTCDGLLHLAAAQEFDDTISDLRRIRTAATRLQALLEADLHCLPPLEEAEPAAPPAGAESSQEALDAIERPEPTSGRRGHVLVVDDNRFNREILARGLYRQNHDFALAADGRQALELLAEGVFDLVLLDILMPEMDGFEVLRRLKADPQLRDVPVIMISALDDISGVVRCIEMGAEDFLPKPFDPVLLRARVGACLEKKRLRDLELEYLRNVARVTEAAGAVERGDFDPDSLAEVAGRPDQLGRLARVFQQMAREVRAREQRLQEQVQRLRIEIDETRKARQVAEITDTGYFQQLRQKAQELKKRTQRPAE
jgi:DNA-binding response OmpR family regulator